jgi:hypothetical protein
MRIHTLVLLSLTGFVAACDVPPTRPSMAGEVSAEGLSAKGGGKPPSYSRNVVAELRCPGPDCTGSDRVRGDGGTYNVQIGGDGNLAFSLTDTARRVTFDFSDCVGSCTGGNRWFTTSDVGQPHSLWMHTSVLVPGTEDEVPGGFHAIPVGQTYFSRIKILFRQWNAAGSEFAWAIRFNPFFPGSTNLQVTRTSDTEWILEALPSQTAWTQSAPVGKRAGDPVFEGNYLLPFKMTVRVQ